CNTDMLELRAKGLAYGDHVFGGAQRPAIKLVVGANAPIGPGVAVMKRDPRSFLMQSRGARDGVRFYGMGLDQIRLNPLGERGQRGDYSAVKPPSFFDSMQCNG